MSFSIQGVLLTLVAIAAAGLLAAVAGAALWTLLRLVGMVLSLIGASIAIVVGAAFDLLAATFALVAIAWNSGVTLALVMLGRWSAAERRASAVHARLLGIWKRLRNAAWDRPCRLLLGSVAVARPGARPLPPPPPQWMQPRKPAAAPAAASEERSLASAVHLIALSGLLFPFANIFGPLILWIAKKDSSRFLDDQGREAISFNITMTIAAAAALLTVPLLVGIVALPIVAVIWIAFVAIAGIKAAAGERYRYPLCIPFAGRPPRERAGAAADPPTSAPPRTNAAGPGPFAGYEIVGTLAPGGSGAKLFIARPLPGSRVRLPAGFDRAVIKSFQLSEGSTLPQIVRESRAMEAATRLGLVLEHHLDRERFWYAMPYYRGTHFGEATHRLHLIGPREGLDAAGVATVVRWLSQLAATLDRYHAAGLWHKDVKPDNVIVGDGRAQLVDIGLVSSLSSAMTLTTHGTEYFRDPEMVRMALRGAKVHEVDGVRFDLYGLGAMLYLAIEDTFPAHGGLSRFSKRSPESLRWVARRAMAEYSKRYRSAAEMLADLGAIAAAADPFALLPADLPSMRAAAGAAGAPAEAPAPAPDADSPSDPPADPIAAAEATIDRIEREIAGFESSIGAAGSAGSGSRGLPRERARRSALTSPGAPRGSGRRVAAVALFAAGMILALLWASLFVEPREADGRDAAAIVVIGPQGPLSVREDSLLMASLREHFAQHRRIPAVRLVAADARVASDVARLAEPLRPRARERIFDRLDDAGIRGAVVIDSARGMAIVAAASPIVRSTALWGAIELGEWGSSWVVDQVPFEQILPAMPGQRVLLLRDPAATAVIAPGETEAWRALGIEVVEPDAETAAELALLLARPLGPEGRARIDAILEAQRCDDLRQVREALPGRRSHHEPPAAAREVWSVAAAN
jgi:uncharacterized Tic20 family protein